MTNELKDIYDRITFLRHKGVRMKDIALRADLAPSVLSALFTTVLPAYFKNLDKGLDEAAALDEALVWVNNVSKKRLLSSAATIRDALMAMPAEAAPAPVAAANPCLAALEHDMKAAVGAVANFSGTYMSYSLSSGSPAMKAEPYLIAPAAGGDYVEVIHRSAYGITHHGYALINGLNHLYLTFNESPSPHLALFNICLKLPMYDRPPFLRGLYTCLDYNYNPIARRILFVKLSDDTSREAFMALKGGLRGPDELTDEERPFYAYTCGPADAIRMCNVLAPQMSVADLAAEKALLGQ